MRFNCPKPETWAEKTARLKAWHRKFAWLPVRVGDDDCRWLEFVLRRGVRVSRYDGGYWDWQYQEIPLE
jgi:hypothetical protein